MKNATANLTTYVNVNDGTPSISTIDAPTTMSEVCLLMRRVADTLEAAIAALPAPIASQPLPLTHPARTTRQYAPTDWSRLLPRGEEPVASTLFDSPKFRERYRPGGTVEIYAGAGEGYRRVSRTLCMPYYKVGITGPYGIKMRFRAPEDLDFEDQFPSLIRTEMTLSPNSPIRATRNSIVVTLPEGMSQLDFEREFRAAIAHCAVHTFLQTDDGLRHCRLINTDPQVGLRMTAYGHGAGRRMSPADEIYTIRPSRDGDALLTVVERIILRRLGLLD